MPTFQDIKKALVTGILVILPAILWSIIVPDIWSDWQLTGDALWQLQRKGAPNELVEPLFEILWRSQ